ncbi:MAG: hypothetical protein IPL53_21250 [Ignavibacteria bacterium]|nr:hypothetical protein [Ignavibacteria bacterium]
MQDLYFSNLKEAHLLLEKTKVKDEDYYLRKYQLNIISSTYDMNNRSIYDYKMYNEGLKNIDYHFIALKLWSFVNIIFLKRLDNKFLVQRQYFEKVIIEFIESKKNDFAKHHPYIYFLYLAYKMFSTFDDKYYNLLVSYFNNNREKLKKRIIQSYYAYLNYFLRNKLNNLSKNYTTYQKKLYNLYIQTFNSRDKYKHFVINGLIQNSLYISVASIYLKEGDKENAISFIHKYKKYLHKDLRQDLYNYSMGLYHYNNEEFETAIVFYNKISDKSITLKFNRKAALMRIYFELGDMISLNNEMTNMYQLSYRNKKAGKLYNSRMVTSLKYFRSLIRLKSLKSSSKNISYEKNVLRKQIEKMRIIHYTRKLGL